MITSDMIPDEVVEAAARALALAENRTSDEWWPLHMRRARFTIAAAPGADPWRPMETAPRDGTEFLAVLSNGWYMLLRAVDYRPGEPWQYWRGSRDVPMVDTHPANTDWQYAILATHWMPLPAPPAAETEDRT